MPTTTSVPSLLESAFEAINRGDAEPLIDLYATDDVVLIGTEEQQWHEGPSAIASALRADVGGGVRVDSDLRPIDMSSDCVLLVGRLSFILPDGAIFRARATYAMRWDGERWRIAHSHLSMPVAA